MAEYIQVEFPSITPEQKDILIAQLASVGFEGFEETDDALKAFIPSKNFHEDVLIEIAGEKTIFNKSVIKETNWTKVWESNFNPVCVDDFVAVRAEFHQPIKGVQHEIIITPKMSFGTGHHATTFMMIRQMGEIDFTGKIVLEFGTGTGVLAILAEKLGAKKITAIDNDEWSIENANENISNNHCSRIELIKADTASGNSSFDVILANINKNVILDNFSSLVKHLAPGGVMLLSGLLADDEDVIFRKSGEYSLHLIQTAVRDNWLCLKISC